MISSMKIKPIYKHSLVAFVSGSLLVGLLLFVDPGRGPLIVLLLPVALLWLVLFHTVQSIRVLLFHQSQSTVITTLIGVVTSAIVLLFLLAGVGEVGLQDIVLVFLLASAVGLYIDRTWS